MGLKGGWGTEELGVLTEHQPEEAHIDLQIQVKTQIPWPFRVRGSNPVQAIFRGSNLVLNSGSHDHGTKKISPDFKKRILFCC